MRSWKSTEQPEEFQIRNSNAYSLAAQVGRAGGVPRIMPLARDTVEHTREIAAQRLRGSDLLLFSGGVSAGKYDVVEQVLAELRSAIPLRPRTDSAGPAAGLRTRPLDKFFFGLPGNPSSTMVTFEIFARAALELLSGQEEVALHMPYARLTRDFRQHLGLTRFLPAHLSADGGEVTPVEWHGSGDIPALTRANAYLVSRSRPRRVRARRMDPGAAQMKKLSHYDSAGSPRMVDVSAKPETRRTARAHAFVRIAPAVLEKTAGKPQGQSARNRAHRRHRRGQAHVGAHPAVPSAAAAPRGCGSNRGSRRRAHRRRAATTGQTGVEMEALTAAAVAALTVYDMTKALDKSIEIQRSVSAGKDRREEAETSFSHGSRS